MTIAVIDMGTNMFNVLVVEIMSDKSYKILFHKQIGIKLGKGGINKHIITSEAFDRAINGIAILLDDIKPFCVDKIKTIATSGIRSAKNGNELVQKIKTEFNIDVDVISGDEEAELIYMGVKQIIDIKTKPVLILDIGGGSNEFIIADQTGILWKHSFDLGVARLLERFNPSDPITIDEVKQIEKYLDPELKLLYQSVTKYQPKHLIGCSGAFESFSLMVIEQKEIKMKIDTYYNIDLCDFKNLHLKLLASTIDARKKIRGLEPVRAEMIVMASIFTNFIIEKLDIQKLTQSAFAIKEGMVDKIANS
ncbi:MAG: hypothetical protein MI739_07890 [Bacteroidales bacterium]|nr:hypothetical protein [Bacteroidales bacterium]